MKEVHKYGKLIITPSFSIQFSVVFIFFSTFQERLEDTLLQKVSESNKQIKKINKLENQNAEN